jgi:Tfp pilus assembly protein PilO
LGECKVKRLSARERVLLVAAGGTLIILVLVFAVMLPMLDRGVTLTARTRQLSARMERALSVYRTMPQTEKQLAALREEIGRVVRGETAAAEEVVRDIDHLTADLGLRLESLRPGKAERVSGCVRYPATFDVVSGYASIVRLLYALEQPEHRLWVEAVKISPSGGSENELRASVRVVAYTLEGSSEEGDAGS